eukprot:4496675-Prymnesium_polylepis.1
MSPAEGTLSTPLSTPLRGGTAPTACGGTGGGTIGATARLDGTARLTAGALTYDATAGFDGTAGRGGCSGACGGFVGGGSLQSTVRID